LVPLLACSRTADAGGPRVFTCAARMADARAELLRASFDPAKDTPRWLTVTGEVDGGVSLRIFTVYSPDGDGRRTYDAELRPGRKPDGAWRVEERNVADEFGERLPEFGE